MKPPFHKILIANRGEIACRVIRTCRRLGVKTAAVFSNADRNARHVRLAGEAHRIGGAAPADSYLNIGHVIGAARAARCDAVHPGYGFLSENADFARACAGEKIVFIGPPAEAIAAMGDKSAAAAVAERAGAAALPGHRGAAQDDATLRAAAKQLGFPLLIKSCAGGGGRGMKIVREEKNLTAALASARREAQNAFGDRRVLLEKFIAQPRHVEVQIFADRHGGCVSLFERDCSVQRRFQKIIEEAPCPVLHEQTRAAMGAAAVRIARAANYCGAGTVEFLVDGDAFYFMEMNTRLQVEHALTEMVTGCDLVEWQLRIAAGEPLPPGAARLRMEGCAVEARVYAEDPSRDFAPAPGVVTAARWPAESKKLRVDSGVDSGDTVSEHYDSLLAKIIARGETRAAAVDTLARALVQTAVTGVRTNVEFLHRVLRSPQFAAGSVDANFIARSGDTFTAVDEVRAARARVMAAVFLALPDAAAASPASAWTRCPGWRLNQAAVQCFGLRGDDGTRFTVTVHGDGLRMRVVTADGESDVENAGRDGETVRAVVDGAPAAARVLRHGGVVDVFTDGHRQTVQLADAATETADEMATGGGLFAPMPGRVVRVMVKVGDLVDQGDALLVLEAMKMEHTIRSPRRGAVASLHCKAGDSVSEGAELAAVEAEAAP